MKRRVFLASALPAVATLPLARKASAAEEKFPSKPVTLIIPFPAGSAVNNTARVLAKKTPAHAFLEHVRLGGSKPEPTSEMILGQYVHALMDGDLSGFEVGTFDDY